MIGTCSDICRLAPVNHVVLCGKHKIGAVDSKLFEGAPRQRDGVKHFKLG